FVRVRRPDAGVFVAPVQHQDVVAQNGLADLLAVVGRLRAHGGHVMGDDGVTGFHALRMTFRSGRVNFFLSRNVKEDRARNRRRVLSTPVWRTAARNEAHRSERRLRLPSGERCERRPRRAIGGTATTPAPQSEDEAAALAPESGAERRRLRRRAKTERAALAPAERREMGPFRTRQLQSRSDRLSAPKGCRFMAVLTRLAALAALLICLASASVPARASGPPKSPRPLSPDRQGRAIQTLDGAWKFLPDP